jgi:biotin transport system substrate-specific component
MKYTGESTLKRKKVFYLVLCAMFAAIISVFSVITLPIGPVPISMSVFAIMLTGLVLSWKLAAVSTAVYILMGVAGLPVFSGFRGGFSVIVGPTGGFISSYIFMVLIIAMISRINVNGKIKFVFDYIACILGLFVCYALGTIQFMAVMETSLQAALAACVYPFVLLDMLKAAAAVSTAAAVHRALPQVRNI